MYSFISNIQSMFTEKTLRWDLQDFNDDKVPVTVCCRVVTSHQLVWLSFVQIFDSLTHHQYIIYQCHVEETLKNPEQIR